MFQNSYLIIACKTIVSTEPESKPLVINAVYNKPAELYARKWRERESRSAHFFCFELNPTMTTKQTAREQVQDKNKQRQQENKRKKKKEQTHRIPPRWNI